MKANRENFRILTPLLVSISLALLGVIWNAVTNVQTTVSELRERMAAVEAVLHLKNK